MSDVSSLFSLVECDDFVDDPLEALQQALVFLGGALLHADYRNRLFVYVVTDPEGIDELLAFQGMRKVLLVGEDHYGYTLCLFIREYADEFVPRICEFGLIP